MAAGGRAGREGLGGPRSGGAPGAVASPRPACRMTTERIREVAAEASSAEVKSPSVQNQTCAPSPTGPSPGGAPSGAITRKTGL